MLNIQIEHHHVICVVVLLISLFLVGNVHVSAKRLEDDHHELYKYIKRKVIGEDFSKRVNQTTTSTTSRDDVESVNGVFPVLLSSNKTLNSYSFYLNTNIPTSYNKSSMNCNDISNPCNRGSQILNFFYENLSSQTNVIDIYVIGNLTDCFGGTDQTNVSTSNLLTVRLIGQNPDQYSFLNCRLRLSYINVYFQYFNFYKYNVRNPNAVSFVNCNIDSVSEMAAGMLTMKQTTAKNSDFEITSVIDINHIEMFGCKLNLIFNDLYMWQYRLYQPSVLNNSVIVDSTIELTRLSIAYIENTVFQGSELTAIYLSALEISNCTVYKTKQWLTLKGIVLLSLQHSTIRDGTFEKSSRGIIDSVLASYILINECQFINNNNRAVYVDETGFFHVRSSLFQNNLGGIHIESIVNLGDVLTGTHIITSRFIKNFAFNGGAMILPDAPTTIFRCEFYQNKAQTGGAIYAKFGKLDFIHNTFEGNEAFFISGCLYESCGRGGAVYVEKPTKLIIDQTNRFHYNTARNGGGIYAQLPEVYKPESLKLLLSCSNNTVSYFGSCFYSQQDFQRHDYITILNKTPNVVGSSKLTLVGRNPILYMYPGQRVPFSMDIVDGFNNSLQKMESQPLFSTLDPRVTFSAQFENTTFFLTSQVTNSSVKLVEAFIILNVFNEEKINITVEIVSCPSGFSLTNFDASSTSKKICIKDPDPPLHIILPAIFSSVILFIVGILLGISIIYIGWNVSKKLKRLKRKEKAEKNLQQRLIDKQVVFSEDTEMNPSTDLKTSLLGSYYSNSQGSTSRKKIKEKIRFQEEQNYLIPIENVDIVRKLAEGSNGIVYLAKWLGTDVAMKSLKLDYITEEENEEFEREAALLKSLKHPNIVSSYGVCMSGNLKYMVVEYMARGSLDRAIYESRTGSHIIKLKQKLNILLGVANGMNYLHSLNPYSIIHRDLKPGNILLDKNLSSKVTDFGLSKIIGGNSTNTMTTALGTLFYMSPEILGADSTNEFSTKLDVYSFAIIMYELLFEEPPYLNNRSQKIYRFATPNTNTENSFNIPARVVKGLRPTIPFSSQEEQEIWIKEFVLPREPELEIKVVSKVFTLFIDLMIECWSEKAKERPDFGAISDGLSEILEMF